MWKMEEQFQLKEFYKKGGKKIKQKQKDFQPTTKMFGTCYISTK